MSGLIAQRSDFEYQLYEASRSLHPGQAAPWFLDPAYRLVLANADDANERYRVVFNPSELDIAVEVTIGRLTPIGWSHPVKQYAHTGEVKIPLKFWISSLAMLVPPDGNPPEVGAANAYPDVRGPVTWLQSFCYADAPGMAPPHMLLLWPNNLCIRVTVESVQVRYTLWDTEMIPRIAEVSMMTSEVRKEFRSRGTFKRGGFMVADEFFTQLQAERGPKTARKTLMFRWGGYERDKQ